MGKCKSVHPQASPWENNGGQGNTLGFYLCVISAYPSFLVQKTVLLFIKEPMQGTPGLFAITGMQRDKLLIKGRPWWFEAEN